MPDPSVGSEARGSSARTGAATSLLLDLLSRDGAVWVREASLSMSPLIRPGDEVCLVCLDKRRVARGSLIAYRREEGLVLHRVLARNGAGVVAKGDALASADPPVGWEEVVGRVTALRRAGKPKINLDAFPWPQVNHALGVVASIACRLAVEDGAGERSSLLPRLAWKLLRAPFFLARCLVP